MAELGGVLFLEYVFVNKGHVQAALLSELFPPCVFPEVAIGDIAKTTGVGGRAEYFMRPAQYEVPKARFGIVNKQEFGSLWVFHSINLYIYKPVAPGFFPSDESSKVATTYINEPFKRTQ